MSYNRVQKHINLHFMKATKYQKNIQCPNEGHNPRIKPYLQIQFTANSCNKRN